MRSRHEAASLGRLNALDSATFSILGISFSHLGITFFAKKLYFTA